MSETILYSRAVYSSDLVARIIELDRRAQKADSVDEAEKLIRQIPDNVRRAVENLSSRKENSFQYLDHSK